MTERPNSPEERLRKSKELGEAVLAGGLSSEQVLEALAKFIDAIEQLPIDELKHTHTTELQALALLNSRVMEFGSTLKGEWSKELAAFRARGKGILAYADQLPRSLNSRPGRKG